MARHLYSRRNRKVRAPVRSESDAVPLLISAPTADRLNKAPFLSYCTLTTRFCTSGFGMPSMVVIQEGAVLTELGASGHRYNIYQVRRQLKQITGNR